ncbi:MAG: helix-turn-helix transcriptional regulator [Haloglomus sp.]
MTEWLRYLARSETRYEILEAVGDGRRSATKQAVQSVVDASRSTVTRSLEQMAEFGWVTETAMEYRLTALGAHVRAAFAEVRDAFEAGERLAPLLQRVPADAFEGLDTARLADARVTEATPTEPLAPIDRVTALRAESETVRELSSVVASDSAEQVAERATAGDSSHEIVLTADLVSSLLDGSDYADAFEAAREAVDFYVYDGAFPFLLALLDDRVAFGAVDENDRPAALVESTDEAVYEWAEETYRGYRDAADSF